MTYGGGCFLHHRVQIVLRSVALRDAIAEMMIGTRAESVAYRQALVVVLEQVLGDPAQRKHIAEWLGERVFGEPMGRREIRRLVRHWREDDTMQGY